MRIQTPFAHCSLAGMILLLFALLLPGCQSDKAAAPFEIRWKLERNFQQNNRTLHEMVFTLTNTSAEPMGDNWSLYWNQAPRDIIELDSGESVSVQNINGDFYEMKARPGFSLAPGQSATISILAEGWMIKEADAPVGLYQVFNQNGAERIFTIENYRITPFEAPEQIRRSPSDAEPLTTPEYLYRENQKISRLSDQSLYPFIPSPVRATRLEAQFLLEESAAIAVPEVLAGEAAFLRQQLVERYGVNASIEEEGAAAPSIMLRLDASLEKPESYTIRVKGDRIEIAGQDPAGVFYGIQSLLALVEQDGDQRFVPGYEISDSPVFAYRGMHLDLGRNFQSKETILRLLDLLALYKVNKFLFYLTEDEGWRLAIEELPELTQVGARRGHTLTDSLYLQPAYGSGPSPDDPASNGNGHYSREDYKEILRYAQDRHIEVIPAFNMPGHARAAIKAMEYRYHRLMEEGKPEEAERYRLADPEETSAYRSAQYYTDNIACVCRDQIYRFYETVLEDVAEMHEEAGVPLRMIHTGGDEVPAGPWTESPICREYLEAHPEIGNARNLQTHFFDRLTRMIADRGLKIGGWEEVVMAYDERGQWVVNTEFTGRRVYPYIWNNLWGQQDLGYRIANRGYPVILCPVTNTYFDLAYNNDPREPGLYWAGFVDTRDAFTMMPYDLFRSTTEDDMGRSYDPAVDFAGMERLTASGRANIAGLQCQLWSETVRGRDMLEYYILPKLLGFAQRAWEGSPPWAQESDPAQMQEALDMEWNRFANTVGRKSFPVLDELNGGYPYRIPPPGILKQNDTIYMNTAYPGLEIRYTTDGSEPDASSPLYQEPFLFEGRTLTATCFNRKGRSGFSSSLVNELKQ